MSFGAIYSEALMFVLNDMVAISYGSACTSETYEPSHALLSMSLTRDEAETATRWSWFHMTPRPNWNGIIGAIKMLL